MYEDEPLKDYYTLMDIAYIYTWRRVREFQERDFKQAKMIRLMQVFFFFRMVPSLWSIGFVPGVRSWSWVAQQAVELQVENLKQRVTQEVKSSAVQFFMLLLHLLLHPLYQVRVLHSNLHTQASLISHLSTECLAKPVPTAKFHSATKPARAQSMAPTLLGDKRTNGHGKASEE